MSLPARLQYANLFICYDRQVERSIDNVSVSGVLITDLTFPFHRYISYLSVSNDVSLTSVTLYSFSSTLTAFNSLVTQSTVVQILFE